MMNDEGIIKGMESVRASYTAAAVDNPGFKIVIFGKELKLFGHGGRARADNQNRPWGSMFW